MRPKGVALRLEYFVHGVRYRYPLCCILRFVFDGSGYAGRKRGSITVNGGGFCVPCGIFHRAGPCFVCGCRRAGHDQDVCDPCHVLTSIARVAAREEMAAFSRSRASDVNSREIHPGGRTL